jgi:hypothetical protein
MSNGSEKHASPQNSAETPQDIEIDHKISLVRGGPFYRAQKAIRLLDANRWNLGRRITLAIVVCWVPLVLITLFLNPHATKGLLSDYPVNVRMLIAIPILLGGQILMENVFRKIVRHIGEAGLLTPSDMERLDRTLVTLIRLRDSAIPEAIIVLIIFFHVLTQIHSQLAIALPWAVTGTEASAHITPAGWYYCVVSQLFYQFLLFVSIWKWTLWTAFLFRLSKLDLQIVPTHPDKHGGLGFLGMSPTQQLSQLPLSLLLRLAQTGASRFFVTDYTSSTSSSRHHLVGDHAHRCVRSALVLRSTTGKASSPGDIAIRHPRPDP